ncbi:hypothetical protein THAOC_20970 [Thalassiosira oceanica]|uniref:Uncharacterized protein n=1 Tax=Thalassiosira oceanica TaxID=159749 RepID=K0SD45_THAOC|nr:hypothetical protein THAOC_20970 [Thalassiosira oceanica]|eukprot:EJK58871.1 hypothetical protein THAOC_20970 [Thalassiosira oceanica]
MANIGWRCTIEVAEECIPEQNCPPISITPSAEAVDPAITDDFGIEVERRSTPDNYTARRTPPSARGVITGFEIRRFSNGDLHAADSQVNYKYVQMDVGTLTDGLSPNIHRSMAIASIIRFACFRLLSYHSLFNRVLPEGLLCYGKADLPPYGETHRSVVKGTSAMSLEYAGKRQRGDGDGFAAALDPAKTSATSSADLESMLKQALGRIDSLERQHEEVMMSMGRENRALRDGMCRLTEDNKAVQASTERQIEDLRDDIEALKSKNKALEWSLNRLASKVQEGWEYPVAIQPDEYWQDNGYDDEAIEYLKEGFFEEVKVAVSKLEHGVCKNVTVCSAGHDEDLMPHWNALFRSFKHINPYDAGVALSLIMIESNEEMMRQICNHVWHRNISTVEFRDNGFANMQDAISELGKALKSRQLKSLAWLQNSIESTEDMNLFTRVLSRSNAVDKLTFARNSNENAQALLSDVDFSRYKLLNLSSNDLQTNGRTDIPDLIAVNSPLEELYLYSNRLNDDDAVLIAQSLSRNTHLGRLNMENNNMQARGMRALYEAVNDTSTLNALSDSNHSCYIDGLSDDFDLSAINLDSGANGIDRNRMCKIYQLMVERYRYGGGNVPHLNSEMGGEDTVLLAPYLMESVVRRHDAFQKSYYESSACSLGLLYELVKDWKMAELFSFK